MTGGATLTPSSPVGIRGHAAVGVAACLWGTWSLFFRPAQDLYPISPAAQSALVCGSVFLIAAPLAWRGGTGAARPPRAWGLLAGLGAVDAGNVLFFFMAMQKTSLAVAVLTHYLALPLVAVTAPLLLRERTGPRAWTGLAVALTGLLLLVEPWRVMGAPLAGAILGALSALFFTMNVLGSKLAASWFTPQEVLAWRYPVLIPILLVFTSETDRVMLLAPAGLTAAAWVVAAGLIVGAIAGLLYYWGLSRVPASHATTLSLLEPVVAILIGVLVWSEIPGPAAAVGALLILGALAITATSG